MNTPLDENEEILWQDLIKDFFKFAETSRAFFKPEVDRVKLLREGFRRGEIAAALHLTSSLESAELSDLLPELVYISTAHGYARKTREIILSLPHDWLITHIEEVAEPILQSSDEFDFRQIFQLYLEVDRAMAARLAEKAINHSDEYIREVGRDFLEILSKTGPVTDV